MNLVSKIFNKLSVLVSVITLLLLYLYNGVIYGFYYNGVIFLIILFMFLNPIANMCRINKKIIVNPIYHSALIILNSYISFVIIKSLTLYKEYLINPIDNGEALNQASSYFGDKFLYIFIGIIILLLISFIFKKKEIKGENNNAKVMLIAIIITSIIPFIGNTITHEMIFSLSQLLFSIVLLVKLNGINTASELQKYYLASFILGILAVNPIAIVLSLYMFIQLDKFGLHI